MRDRIHQEGLGQDDLDSDDQERLEELYNSEDDESSEEEVEPPPQQPPIDQSKSLLDALDNFNELSIQDLLTQV